MIQSSSFITFASLLVAALVASGTETANAGSSFTSGLEKALKKVEQDLCKSVESLKCKRKAPAGKSAPRKTKAKPPAKQSEKPATAKLVPIPRQKPAQAVEPKPVEAKPIEAEASEIKKPRMKPAMPETAIAEKPVALPTAKPLPPEVEQQSQVTVLLRPASMPRLVIPPLSAQPSDECRDALKSLGVSFVMPPTSVNIGLCTVSDPVKLTSFNAGGESIAFPDGPVLNCSFALRFSEWLKAEGAPIAKRTTKSALDKFYTGPGFECRGRNGDGTAKISEHGYGNAVDITFVKLKDGRTINVRDALDPMSPAYQTLAEWRASGCMYFSTVLGPGANAAHAEHFHFDMGKHGKSGTYMVCQ